MRLPIETRDLAGWTVVSVGGEIDMDTAPDVREALLRALRTGTRKIVADLGEVTFLDSCGLSVLVATQRRVSALDGQLRLVVTASNVREVLRVTQLDHVLSIHPSLDDAVAVPASSAD